MRYRIGLNINVDSVKWAIIKHNEEGEPISIENTGERSFEICENIKDGSSLAKERREIKSIRRRVRRRKHRIYRVKKLILKYNILQEDELLNLYNNTYDGNIYKLKIDGLDRKLSNSDLAKVLINAVKKRGYQSNVELDESENDEDGKVLIATKDNKRIMIEKGYRSISEMYLKDSKFKILLPDNTVITKIRNTSGKYKSTVLRAQVREEIMLILNKQKNLNENISQDFINEYMEIFDSQRPYDEGTQIRYSTKQIDKMLGKCIFEKQENRAVKASYSYEYFDLLKQLNNIIIEKNIINKKNKKTEKRKFSKEEKNKIIELAKFQSKISYYEIRKELDLSEYERFAGVEYSSIYEFSDSVNKTAERKIKIEGFPSYFRIKQALYYINPNIMDNISKSDLDEISYILTVYKSNEKRIEQFKQRNINLPFNIIQELFKISFTDISYLSLKAIKKITPYLEEGFTYNVALNKAYPNISTKLSNINSEILNPVCRRAVSQSIKVINAIINKYGNPDLINIFFNNEIGKTKSERNKIKKAKQENSLKIDKIKQELIALGIEINGKNIAKYKLWKEQSNYCIYSGKNIDISALFTDEIDINYIIPFWMCFDDTYKNKILTFSSEIKAKGDLLPYNYILNSNRNIEEYKTRVDMLVRNYSKKNILVKSNITKEEIVAWRNRNIEDTQYIGKWITNYLNSHINFTDCKKYNKKVLTISPNFVSYINRKLSISNETLAIAAISSEMLNKIMIYNKTNNMELPYPWENFKNDVINFPIQPVSKAPRRKVKGPAHNETIKRMQLCDNFIKCINRVDIKKLKLNSEGEIENFSAQSKKTDKILYNALKEKLEENGGEGSRAFIDNFYKPKKDNTPGIPVKKVKIESKTRLPILLKNKAIATNGTIIRLDIFKVENEGFYFVPIYVKDTILKNLPNKACVSQKAYSEWPEMKEENFIFSLYPKDLIYIKCNDSMELHSVEKENDEKLEVNNFFAYYIKADISSASICISNYNDNSFIKKIGIKTLIEFRKYDVDVLGNYHKIHIPEKRLNFNNSNHI